MMETATVSPLSLFNKPRTCDWRWVRPRIDLNALPTRAAFAPPRLPMLLAVGFGCIWMIISLPILVQMADIGSPALLFSLLFPAIGLAFVITAGLQFFRQWSIRFDPKHLTVESRSLSGANTWTLPYRDFKGVLLKERTVRGKNRSTTFQIIELHHDDPAKCLPLFVDASTESPRTRWETYARRLDLPALEESKQGVSSRNPDELDKSLRELVSEGKLSCDYDPSQPPPRGLAVWQDGMDGEQVLHIGLTAGRIPVWSAGFLCGIPLILLIVGMTQPESWPMAMVAAAFLALTLSLVVWDKRKRREIRVSRRELAVVDPWPWDRSSADRLPVDEIESLRIVRAPSNAGNELVVAGDTAQIRVGVGLSENALAWLKDYLTAAIATA